MTPRDRMMLNLLEPPEDLKRRVLEAAHARPVRSRSARLVPGLALAALAAAAMFATISIWGWPAHAAGRPVEIGTWVVFGTIALAVVATSFSLPPRRSMLFPPRAQLLAVIIGVPIVMGAWLLLWHTAYPDPEPVVGVRCFILSAVTAPWPFLVLTYAGRRFDPRHPGLVGAALGATAGAWAAVMVELWCPRAVPDHVLIGHVLPFVFLSIVGALYGSRRLRLRRVA